MRRFIISVFILFFSVWLGLNLAKDPGLALFTYRDWSIEMPLWFASVCLLVMMLFVYFLVRFFDSVDDSFYRWRNWLRWRRKNKAYSKTHRGLLELIEGHWKNAENDLLEGIDQSDTPLINYLAAAKAAHERKAYDKRDMYLHQAHDLAPKAHIAISLTQAKLQMDQGQLEQALATLTQLRNEDPLQPIALRLLEKVYVRLGDWKNLLNLMPCFRKIKLYTTEQLDHLEQNIYRELFITTANKLEGLKNLRDLWKNLPRKLSNNPRIAHDYVQQLLHYSETSDEAEELISHVVKKNWDSDLVKLYGFLMTNNPKKQLAHAEKWLKLYPDQALAFLTAARLCLRCRLWEKARGYLDESLKLATLPEIYIEYGKLFEELGDVSLAVQNYREGLGLG